MIPQSEWRWFGNAGHFICSFDCRFHLCTLVGNVLVSTVGEYFPDYQVREVLAASRGIKLEGRGDERKYQWLREHGYEEIGLGRKYETMAFRAGEPCSAPECGCGLPTISGSELTTRAANDAGAATAQHYEVCFLASEGTIEANEYGSETLMSTPSQEADAE